MLQKEELWKDIKGYEGRYQVSNKGRVKSLTHVTIRKDGKKLPTKGRILKPRLNPSGYLQVNLCDSSGEVKQFYVHRLVCETFHGNSKDKPCVNHIDENKTNNVASNLEWCTYEENNNHGTHNARAAKTKSKPVGQYTPKNELIKVWQSAIEVQRQLGFDNTFIGRAARGKVKTAYGYVWKFIEED